MTIFKKDNMKSIDFIIGFLNKNVTVKRLIATSLLMFVFLYSQAQSYNYLTTTGSLGTTYSWIDCTSGTSVTSGDDAQATINWPFNFRFYDSQYSTSNTLSVCTNGFIRLDGTASTSYSEANSYLLESGGTGLGQIIALAVYDAKVGDGGGWVRYLTTGTSPNRIFTIEYNNLEVDYDDARYADVQVSFYETSGKIVLKLKDDNITKSAVDMGIHSGTAGYFHKWQEVLSGTNNTWIEYSPNIVEVNATGGTSSALYTTLKSAFDAINAGTHTSAITVKLNGNAYESATSSLNASGVGSASYSSVQLYPTVTGLSISGSLSTSLIQLNGADNVTIDGRVNLSGSASLTISNTSTAAGARTIEFLNSAETNYLQYCNLKGSGTSATDGTIYFGTSTAGNGNDGNYIQYNNLSAVSISNRPVNLIYSLGASGYVNDQNFIRNNNFDNFLNGSIASNGICVSSYSSGYSITDNNFYQSSAFSPASSVEHAVIRIDNTSGTDFIVSGNAIGGSAAGASGTWTKTGSDNEFKAIYMNVGSSGNSVQNNAIKGFNYTNSGAAGWSGIEIASGVVNVGTSSGNVLGSESGTGSIVFTAGATGATFYGIRVSTTSTVTVANNKIGAITTAASASTNATHFYGIYKSATAGIVNILDNVLGSTVTSGSINASSAATSNSQLVYAIYNLGTGTINVTGNTVANVINSTTETTLGSRIRGIFSNAGANNIANNTVYSLKSNGLSNGANYPNTSIVGISVISKTAGNAQSITGNTVYYLETAATGKLEIYGIYYDGPHATTADISRNFIHTFIIPSGGSAGSYLHGLSLYDGSYRASNNIVYNGNGITVGCSIWGIWTNTNDAAKLYFNTVYLTGTATSGSSNSYAFRSLNCPSSLDVRNNILWDGRTNSSGSISHYAIYLNCTTNVTIDYNDYQYAQQFGIAGGTTYNTFSSWLSGTTYDDNSLNVNPNLVNLGGTLPVDYQTTVQLQGVSIDGITSDFNSVTRVTPTMGAWEYFANPVETWTLGVFREGYTTLKAAFDDINAGQYTGDITIKFFGNTTETASAVLNASGTGAADYSRITVYPARSGVTVTGNLSAPLVDLNGADNVIFDGRVNGTGAANQFTFTNNNTGTNTGTSVFRFYNTAQNDTIRYCVIKGGATGTATGNIILGSSTTGAGNNNNVIHNNNITSLSTTERALYMIYSAGTSGLSNTSNKIVSNNIYDFFSTSASSVAVNMQQYTTSTTISGNSFYQTTAFAAGGNYTYRVIYISDTNSNSNVISNNYIGGSAALATGTFTKTGNNTAFYAISLSVGSTTATTVDGNVIRNISFANTGAANWYGINVTAGKVNIGSLSANTIGAATGTGSIVVTNDASGGIVYPINSSSSGDVQVSNNIIAAITAANSAATNATNMYAIYNSGSGAFTANANTIGSTSTSNSLNASSASTAAAQTVIGILSSGSGTITMSNNIISNIINSTTNTSTSTISTINGIKISSGTSNTVTGNTVNNLSIASAYTGTGSSASVVGINMSDAIDNRTVTSNTVFNLSNTSTTAANYKVIGISMNTLTGTSNVVNRNFIHSLSGTVAGSTLAGIYAGGGTVTYSNNIIFIGGSINNIINGFYDVNATGQITNVYFNTIYITGSGGTNFSAAMNSSAANGTRNYRNNVFYNNRTSVTVSTQIAMYYVSTSNSGLTVNYNDYFVSGSGTVLCKRNTTNYTNIGAIRTATGQDASSVVTNPNFTSGGSTTASDYKVGVSLSGTTGTGVTIDYGANSRPGSSPTMGAWEFNVNRWKGTTSTDWGTASNWTGNTVPGTDESIEFDAAPVNHCIMDIDRSVTNIVNAQGTYRVVTNGKILTVKGELQFTNGAQIDASSTSSAIVFAGTSAQSLPSGALYNNNVYNLIVNNPSNVSLNGTVNLLNTISSQEGFFDAYSNSTTFVYAGSSAQSVEDSVFLDNKAYNFTIDNGVGVTLNTDFLLTNNLLINTSKILTISTSCGLTVNGTLTNNAGAAGLVIKSSDTEPNGSLIFFNSYANAVQASVEMFSKSTWDLGQPSGSRYNWQYFGIPVRSIGALPTFYGGYVRQRNEAATSTATHWVQLNNYSVLSPFIGYELCFQTQRTITLNGELVNYNFNSGQLAKTTGAIYPGQHVLANPYTAAIDIRQIDFGSDMEATVYLYNTGSFNAWNSNESKVGSTPGQYVSVPKNLAGYAGIPRQVPSMSSMLTRVLTSSTNAYVNIPYSSVVMKNSEMQRVKGKVSGSDLSENNIISTVVSLEGAKRADKMWIFVADAFTRNFDNGYDGKKISPVSGMPRIYGSETDFNYNIDAVNDMNNTVLGFRAGVDTAYVLRFEHQNTETKYKKIELLDTKTNTITDITESGSTYSFTATNTTSSVDRFIIMAQKIEDDVTEVDVYTEGENIWLRKLSQSDASVVVTDMAGRVLYNQKVTSNDITRLPVPKNGVYILSVVTNTETWSQKIIMKQE